MATTTGRPVEASPSARGAARLEYRVWGPADDVVQTIERLTTDVGRGESHDVYLVGSATSVNAKVRDSTIDVKHLVERIDDLERWSPAWTADLPVEPETVDRLIAELQLPVTRSSPTNDRPIDAGELGRLVDQAGGSVVPVVKRRRKFELDDARLEVVDVTFPGMTTRTVAVEAIERDDVIAAIDAVGLVGENRAMHVAAARAVAHRW